MKLSNLALAGVVALPMAAAVNVRAAGTPVSSNSLATPTPSSSSVGSCENDLPHTFIPISSGSRGSTPASTPVSNSIRSTPVSSIRTPFSTGSSDSYCPNPDDLPNDFIPIGSSRTSSASRVSTPTGSATGSPSTSAGSNGDGKTSTKSSDSTGSAPSSTGKPAITDLPLSTSTYTATKTYTITQCPPEVTNCPIGSVTTATVTEYTTYCPAISTPLTYTVTSTVPCKSCQGGQQTTPVTVTIVPAPSKSGSNASASSGANAPTTQGGNSPIVPTSGSAGQSKASQSAPVPAPSSVAANQPGSNGTYTTGHPSANATVSTTSGNRPVASGPTSGAASWGIQGLFTVASGVLIVALL